MEPFSDTPTLDRTIDDGERELVPMRRRLVVNTFVMVFVVLTAACVGFLLSTARPATSDESWWIFGIVTGVVLIVVLAVRLAARGRLTAAGEVTQMRLIHAIDPGVGFTPRSGVERDTFQRANVHGGRFFNRYNGSDLWHVDSIAASHLVVEHQYTRTYSVTEYYTDARGQQQSRIVQKTEQCVDTVFSGTLVVMPHDPPMPVELVMSRDAGLARKLVPQLMANADVSRHWPVIASNDGVAAHRYLEPAMLEQLAGLPAKLGVVPTVILRDRWLYVALPGVRIGAGRLPGVWTGASAADLRQMAADCEGSIRLLRDLGRVLWGRPSTARPCRRPMTHSI